MPWGGTPSVSRGTCATPVAGTSVGAKRTCTVRGLSAGTTYSFELVAYRGTLNVNAVFGGLSNAASGATTSSSSGGVESGGGGAPGGAPVLLQEDFADGAVAARGGHGESVRRRLQRHHGEQPLLGMLRERDVQRQAVQPRRDGGVPGPAGCRGLQGQLEPRRGLRADEQRRGRRGGARRCAAILVQWHAGD